MKKFMFCLSLILCLFTNPVIADSAGVYFEPARNGEGAAIFTQDETFVAFIYTYNDGQDTLPPVVGPAPPRIFPECTNATTWYVAQSTNFDGNTASGEIYSGEAIDYPYSFDGEVGVIEQVGEFIATKVGQGWDISISYTVNPMVDVSESLYRLDFQFRVPLLLHE